MLCIPRYTWVWNISITPSSVCMNAHLHFFPRNQEGCLVPRSISLWSMEVWRAGHRTESQQTTQVPTFWYVNNWIPDGMTHKALTTIKGFPNRSWRKCQRMGKWSLTKKFLPRRTASLTRSDGVSVRRSSAATCLTRRCMLPCKPSGAHC